MVTVTGPGVGALAGVIPILVTPFTREGEVDLNALGREVEFLIEAGVSWAGFGFGSEVDRLSGDELTAVVERALATAVGRLGIFGNVEMRSARGGVEQARRAAAIGVELALVRPGRLAGVPEPALFDAFAAVAEHGGLSIIVQDAPQNTGADLAPATLARLLTEVPGVAAVKIEPANSVRKIEMVVGALGCAEGRVIGGAGGLEYVHELSRGACGTMPGPAYPELFAAVTRLHAKGERQKAHELFARAMPLIVLGKRDMDTFLVTQKHVLVRRGVLEHIYLGQPHTDIDPRLPAEIDELLDALGLVDLFERCRHVGW
jgi:dihydrodipicolinate synthase/N-acetylneuraminate lyase